MVMIGAGKAMRQEAGKPAQIALRNLAAPDPLRLGGGREHEADPSNLACAKRLYSLFPISGVLKPAPLAWRDFPKDSSAMGLQAMIFEQFQQVARDQDKPLAELAPVGMVLLGSGLDSLLLRHHRGPAGKISWAWITSPLPRMCSFR